MATIAASAVETKRRPLVSLVAALAIALAGAAATAVTVWAVARSSVLRDPGTTSVIRGLFVASYIAVGTYTWWRRPESRLGPLIAGAGFLYALISLNASGSPVPFTIGRVLLAVMVVYLAYVFLCFPRDRLGSQVERRIVVAFAAASAFLWILALAMTEELPAGGPFTDCEGRCPNNGLQLVSLPEAVTRLLDVLLGAVTAIALAGVVVLLVRKVRSPARLRRRAVAPLLYAFIVLGVSFAAYGLLRAANLGGHPGVLRAAVAAAALAIPVALLVGQVRGRVFAATSLGQLVAKAGGRHVTQLRVQTLLRDALGDPTLALALWAPEHGGYLDAHDRPLELPDDRFQRTVTPVVHAGRPVAALIHDPSLDESSEVLEGLAATALMLLENTRLVDDLRASRARIVVTAERERLRLERNLHDGAQQRLMAIQIKLALARERTGEAALAVELDEIADDAAAAVDELRALAHGIYPTVLRERGLGDGLRSLANAAAVPVHVVDGGIGRCSPTVETAIYFCSLEAIQNATKHAGPGARVTLTLGRREEDVEFTVADDGAGFEPGGQSPGVGLVNMHDRIGAVGGELDVMSSPGRGTVVSGVVPAAGVSAGEEGERPE